MVTVISHEQIKKHAVDKYKFKILAIGSDSDDTSVKSNLVEKSFSEDDNPGRRGGDGVDTSAMSTSSKESLIESLMQKTDEMSSNFIKLQMKLEAKDEEHRVALEKVKEESYAEGLQEGLKQAAQNEESSLKNKLAQFSSSIVTLENSAKEFESALEGIKGELITAALDIAQEVVGAEVKINSDNIANVLGNELIKELQSASKITLRVNPKNHGFISEQVGNLEHIEIVSDSAVSEGGVIAISDAGNIDAQISKRFQRVKRAALSE